MELRIEKAVFLRGLALAQGIAERKTTMPILANVMVRTEGKDRVVCAATDLSVFGMVEMPAKVEVEGSLTLGARHLHEIVRSLPGAELELKRTENQYAEIRSGKVFYKIVGLPARDFPKLPAVKEVPFAPIDGVAFGRLIAATAYAVSGDETRYHLSGALLEGNGTRLRMVATDGHRLALAQAAAAGPDLGGGVLVPRKALNELKRLLDGSAGTCEFGVRAGNLFVRLSADGAMVTTLAAKLVDAQFPPYEAVIPRDTDKRFVVYREALSAAVRRVMLVASEKSYGIRLTGEAGQLRVSSDNPDLGEAREELAAEECEGPPFQMGFNARYFAEALDMFDDDRLRVELSGDLDPGIVRPVDGDHALAVIMPMRI